jgi:hypothetical protein
MGSCWMDGRCVARIRPKRGRPKPSITGFISAQKFVISSVD